MDNIHPGLAAIKGLFPKRPSRYAALAHLMQEKAKLQGFFNENDVDAVLRKHLATIPTDVLVPIRMWLETL